MLGAALDRSLLLDTEKKLNPIFGLLKKKENLAQLGLSQVMSLHGAGV